MIVSETVAAEAYLPSFTEDDLALLSAEWDALAEDHPLKRVEDLVLDLSQDVFWAGLLSDIEYRLWAFMCMPEAEMRREGLFGTLTAKELRTRLVELRDLTLGAAEPWWFAYGLDKTPLGYSVARQVPLETWLARLPEGMPTPAVGSVGAGA